MRAHGVRRLVLDRLATEERRLPRPHHEHEHQTDQDQPDAQDEYQPDPTDAGAAAIIRRSAVPQGDDQDEEESEATEAYAGAAEEIPSMVPPKRPTTLLFKPFSAISSTLPSWDFGIVS